MCEGFGARGQGSQLSFLVDIIMESSGSLLTVLRASDCSSADSIDIMFNICRFNFNPQQGWSYFLQNTPNFQLLTPNDELLWLIDSIKDIWGLSQRTAAFNYNLVSPLEKTAQIFIKAIILFRVNMLFFFLLSVHCFKS